jgi:hypothetical protein
MTIEKMCFVNPTDIKAVRIACGQCGSATVVPLNQFNSLAALVERNCVTCGTPSGFRRDTTECNRILLLTESLGVLVELMNGRNINYSLQIECPKE